MSTEVGMYQDRSQEFVERLARDLHEAGREAVERGLTAPGREKRPFVEWADADEATREGRRVQVRWLLKRWQIRPSSGESDF